MTQKRARNRPKPSPVFLRELVAEMSPEISVRPVEADDVPDIEALHAVAFGPGRFARTAYRIREGLPAFSPHCLAAFLDGQLAASLRFAPVLIGGHDKALMLGPLAVMPALKGQGIGKGLVADGLQRVRERGIALVILVGDRPYYERFGFRPVPPGQILMPGPVNPARILAAELTSGALATYRGMVAADLTADLATG